MSQYGDLTSVNIPAGGTWVYWLISNGDVIIKGGVSAGGTRLSGTGSTSVVAWRIK